jgi:hypothetical protein
MLCIIIKVDYSANYNTNGNIHKMILYISDPVWLVTKGIADDNTIHGIESINFNNYYYFPSVKIISCKWVRNPDSTSTEIIIEKNDESDDSDRESDDSDRESDDSDRESDDSERESDDELDSILRNIKCMDNEELNTYITINWDSHWDCYCKSRRVCGCGCDKLHDGWSG